MLQSCYSEALRYTRLNLVDKAKSSRQGKNMDKGREVDKALVKARAVDKAG